MAARARMTPLLTPDTLGRLAQEIMASIAERSTSPASVVDDSDAVDEETWDFDTLPSSQAEPVLDSQDSIASSSPASSALSPPAPAPATPRRRPRLAVEVEIEVPARSKRRRRTASPSRARNPSPPPQAQTPRIKSEQHRDSLATLFGRLDPLLVELVPMFRAAGVIDERILRCLRKTEFDRLLDDPSMSRITVVQRILLESRLRSQLDD